MACKLLDVIKKSPKIIKKNTIRFYGHFPENFFFKYKELFKNKNIEYCGIVEQKKIYEELLKSKVALHFNSELFPFALSTKIFEYAAAKVPTLTISPGGEIDDLINMNNWGIIARPEQNEIMRSIQSMQHYKADITNESIEKYHYRNIALNYLKIINNISTEKL
jgi:glycosyltransferase involved in cell wall biosynthesis